MDLVGHAGTCVDVFAIVHVFGYLQWLPLIEDRCFLPWLVKAPQESEVLRAR